MISGNARFVFFIAVTLVVFVGILWWVTRRRQSRPSYITVGLISIVVVVGGMVFAKLTQNAGWPAWIYYGVSAGTTLLLPSIALRLRGSELWQYLVLAFASSPVIHVLFSFFLGWHDYLPFFYVPSLTGH